MTGYLLDTNVISETTKTPPNQDVLAFLSSQEDLWIPIIALHELQFGLERLPHGRRRRFLESTTAEFLASFEERILPLSRDAAEYAGSLRAQAEQSGRELEIADALIAGIAAANALSLATRNAGDFDYLPITIVNPWEPPAEQ